MAQSILAQILNRGMNDGDVADATWKLNRSVLPIDRRQKYTNSRVETLWKNMWAANL